uniref:Uncharacterized protein n=1 Tax=Oryza glumipatula TaxID=40148 RepID=A0A0E0AQM0_9ORYZ
MGGARVFIGGDVGLGEPTLGQSRRGAGGRAWSRWWQAVTLMVVGQNEKGGGERELCSLLFREKLKEGEGVREGLPFSALEASGVERQRTMQATPGLDAAATGRSATRERAGTSEGGGGFGRRRRKAASARERENEREGDPSLGDGSCSALTQGGVKEGTQMGIGNRYLARIQGGD